MQAITIGTGKWAKLAQYSAARMAEMTGLEVRVLGDKEVGPLNLSHPSWAKCWIWNFIGVEDSYVFIFDADLWCMKEWKPQLVHPTRLMVVRDESSDAVRAECQLYALDPNLYFNTGLLITRYIGGVMECAKSYHPKFGRWQEQTAINHVVQGSSLMVDYLPHAYNRLLWPGKDDYGTDALKALGAVNLHFASMHAPDLILSYMKKL